MPLSCPFVVPLCLLAGLSFAGMATAGISARLDALMQTDNRAFADQGQFEARGDMSYADAARKIRTGLSLALRRRDGVSEARLYQLYVEKGLSPGLLPEHRLVVGLGRFQRADGLGFYTLDGAQLRLRGPRLGAGIYAGRAGRIAGFRGLDAQTLYGADVRYALPAQPGLGPGTLRLGWQRLVDVRSVDRITAGWRTSPGEAALTTLLQGSYLPAQRRLENVQAVVAGNLSEQFLARLRFETYTPSQARLTFRQRFYAHYARKGQMTLSGEWHQRLRQGVSGQLCLRRVWREAPEGGYTDNGHGLSLEAGGRRPRGRTWSAQFDHLRLRDDQNTGLYFQLGAALSARRRGAVSGVAQFQQRRLIGANRVLGLEAQVEQAVRAGLYASAFVSFIHNSNLHDEYRAGVRLSYYLDDRGLAVLP